MMTSGLAAAAAVMAAVLLTRPEPQRLRRFRPRPAMTPAAMAAPSWFQGGAFDFDDSLLYHGGVAAPRFTPASFEFAGPR
jgi:hypothetical protein